MASPAVKKAIRCSSSKAPRDDALQPRLRHAEVGAHRGGVLVVELGQLRLQPRLRPRRRPRRGTRRASAIDRGHLVVALVDVGDEEHGLGGQRAEVAQRVGRLLGHRHRPRRAAGLQRRDQLAEPALLGDRRLVAAARLA